MRLLWLVFLLGGLACGTPDTNHHHHHHQSHHHQSHHEVVTTTQQKGVHESSLEVKGSDRLPTHGDALSIAEMQHLAQHYDTHHAQLQQHHPGYLESFRKLGLDSDELLALSSLAEIKKEHDKNNDGVLCANEWREREEMHLNQQDEPATPAFALLKYEDMSPTMDDLLNFHQSNAAVCPLGIDDVAIKWQANEARHWSTNRFVKWLDDNMFGEYRANALKHGIRGRDLIRLATSNHRVMKLLGVHDALERHRMQVRAYDTVMFGPEYDLGSWQAVFRSRTITEIVIVLLLLLIVVIMVLLLLRPRQVVIHHLPLDNVDEWTTQQVHSWLCSVGLERYGQYFLDNGVTGHRLLALGITDLAHLSVDDETDQLELLAHVDRLKARSPTPNPFSRKTSVATMDNTGDSDAHTAVESLSDSGLDGDMRKTGGAGAGGMGGIGSQRVIRCRPENLENTTLDITKGVISRTTTGLLQDVLRARLELLKEVGHGTYGTVYKAKWTYWVGEHESDATLVAAKFLNYKVDLQSSGFDQELRILGRLNHRHIVELIAACTVDTVVLITSYCGAGSLYNFLHNDNQSYNVEWVHRVAKEIASGMVYLHSQQIIHRDLKSQNILLWDRMSNADIVEGEVHLKPELLSAKICDFGLARQIDHATHMTGTPGTPAWMAPEVIRGERCNEKCDVFSYSVVLWELVTREIPWKEFEPVQIMFAVGSDSSKLPIPSGVPQIYKSIIEDGWKRNIHDRPSSTEIYARLEKGEEYMRKKFLEISLSTSQKAWAEAIRQDLEQYRSLREKQSQIRQSASSSKELKKRKSEVRSNQYDLRSLVEEIQQKTEETGNKDNTATI